MRAGLVLLPPALLLLLLPRAAPFTCLDASGAPLDWFMAIKYPASNVAPGNFYTLLHSSAPGAWVNRRCACPRPARLLHAAPLRAVDCPSLMCLCSFQLDSPDGDPITNTVRQMYAADNSSGLNVSFTHAMYVDARLECVIVTSSPGTTTTPPTTIQLPAATLTPRGSSLRIEPTGFGLPTACPTGPTPSRPATYRFPRQVRASTPRASSACP